MEYFMSHILYIVLGGAFVGLIATAWVLLTAKNNQNREPGEEQSCDFTCGSCQSANFCHKEGKQEE